MVVEESNGMAHILMNRDTWHKKWENNLNIKRKMMVFSGCNFQTLSMNLNLFTYAVFSKKIGENMIPLQVNGKRI